MEIGEAATVAAMAPAAATAPAATVTKIKAKVAGTKGVRQKSDTRPDDVLTESTSSSMDLGANAPVTLVRGCHAVQLEAETNPPNTPVTWQVRKNKSPGPVPSILPTKGSVNKATLSTTQYGSFSVVASIGKSEIVWNVVFVWVEVLEETSNIQGSNTNYADMGPHPTFCRFQSGQFVPGFYAWRASVRVKLHGGDSSHTLGIDKVKVHILQNGIADTLTGVYGPKPGTAKEVPKGGLPILDANNSSSPFLFVASVFRIFPDQAAAERRVWTADSPAGSFPKVHQNDPARSLVAIRGINRFSNLVASASDDVPNSIIVHARTHWAADFSGKVDSSGQYTPAGAKTVTQGKYHRISNATGGQDAFEAGVETFEPRFNGPVSLSWVP